MASETAAAADAPICSICQESLSDNLKPIIKLDCTHEFHSVCILKWASTQLRANPDSSKLTCPYCRGNIKLKEIIDKPSWVDYFVMQTLYTTRVFVNSLTFTASLGFPCAMWNKLTHSVAGVVWRLYHKESPISQSPLVNAIDREMYVFGLSETIFQAGRAMLGANILGTTELQKRLNDLILFFCVTRVLGGIQGKMESLAGYKSLEMRHQIHYGILPTNPFFMVFNSVLLHAGYSRFLGNTIWSNLDPLTANAVPAINNVLDTFGQPYRAFLFFSLLQSRFWPAVAKPVAVAVGLGHLLTRWDQPNPGSSLT